MTTKLLRLVVGLVFPVCIMVAGLAQCAMAQEASDIEYVRMANDAFYEALSARDTSAMMKLWSYRTEIRHIGPRNRTVNVGLDAAMKNWEALFAAFPDFKITCEQGYIRINGSTAWVSIIEKARWKNEAGEVQTATHFGTNIFEKQDGKWLMVYHHGSAVPQ